MFANLKKKLEEGGAVSPVGAERKAGNSSVPASNSSRTQSLSYVHGEGIFVIFTPVSLTSLPVRIQRDFLVKNGTKSGDVGAAGVTVFIS